MKKYFISIIWACLGFIILHAQVPLMQYQFETGVDATQWRALSNSATTLLASDAGDEVASIVTPIGFTFHFGNTDYTQFSVNSNGLLRLGPIAASGNACGFDGPFSEDDIALNLPKIDFHGGDGAIGLDGYVKSEVVGDIPNRVLVVEYRMSEFFLSDDHNDITWQVQLYETTNEVKIVFGSEIPSTNPYMFQMGMATSISDVITIDPVTNTRLAGTTNITQDEDNWPSPSRYYHFSIANCTSPLSLTIDNITENSADISWQAGGNEDEWQYICVLHDTMPDWSLANTATSMNEILNNLNEATVYDFYIRSVCGVGDTSDVLMQTFTTRCANKTIPYEETFDSFTEDISINRYAPVAYPNNDLPPCWTYCPMTTSNYGGPAIWLSKYVGNSYTTPHAIDSISLHLCIDPMQHTYVVLPMMNESLHLLMLSFDYVMETTSDVLRIGVVTDPNNISSMIVLDTVYSSITPTHHDHTFVNDGLVASQDYYIVLDAFADNYNSVSGVSIDNVIIDYIPTCLRPEYLQSNHVTGSTAELSWSSNASQFEVAYRLEDGDWMYELTNDTTLILTNLNPLSTYEAKVRAICSDDDTSAWGFTRMFVTECGTYSMPFDEDFSGSEYLSSYSCWRFSKGLVDNAMNGIPPTSGFVGWRITTQGWNVAHAKINVYGTNCNDWLILPNIHIEENAALTFGLSLSDFDGGSLPIEDDDMADDKFYVMVSSDDGNTWNKLATWGSTMEDTYVMTTISATKTDISLSLSSYSGQDIRIAFYAESTMSNGDNDLHIGDIHIEVQAPQCNAPQLKEPTTTAISSQIAWHGEGEHYEVELKKMDNQDWETSISVNDSLYTFIDLTPTTEYKYRVRQKCSEGFYSNWIEGNFITKSMTCATPILTMLNIGVDEATLQYAPEGDYISVQYRLIHHRDTVYGEVEENPFSLTGLLNLTEYRVALRFECATNYFSNWSEELNFTTQECYAVSEVRVDEINETSAHIAWSNGGEENRWQIKYGIHGFSQDEGEVIESEVTQYRLTGLEPNTEYDVYVRAICSTESMSLWSTPAVTFRTQGATENIDGIDGNYNIEIYPNPATHYVTIKLNGIAGEKRINIVDMSGRVLMSKRVMEELKLNVSLLSKGTYFVQVVGEKINSVRKLIIR